jgi:hypothetical protein
MQFMILIDDGEGGAAGTGKTGAFAGELARQGRLRGGALLAPEAVGVRVDTPGGQPIVTGPPLSGRERVIGACLVIETASRAEAVEIAKRCAHLHGGVVEMHLLPDRDVSRGVEVGQYLFLLHRAHDESDPDGSKYREMVAYDEALKREGRYVEISQLARDPVPVRVVDRGRGPVVTDGPFAESREVAAGYYVVAASDRAHAVDVAKRCPHARWGGIEIREVLLGLSPPD